MRTIALLRFLAVLLALFSCLAPVRSAADDYINATYYFSDVTSNPLNVRRITVTYLAPSIELGRTNFSNKPIYYPASTYYMLTNGSITLSNLLTGYALRVAFSDGYSEPAITNYFGTNLSGTVFGNDYKTTALTYQNGSLVQWWYANPESYVASATLTNIIQAVAGEGGGTVQTNISYTAVTNLTSFGALTNNETRALYFSNTVWFADSIQAADSIEAVQFIGGGASLTGLSGTQITSGTISSNKLDATAYVAFMSGGGTGSGSTNVTDTAVGAAQVTNFNVIGTLTANNQSNTTLIVASAYFPYTNAGATFDGDGKLTSSGGVTQAGLAAGSYDLAAAHALGFTNISLIPTQQVVSVNSDNTNIIYATTAGTVAARGTYYWRESQSSYTNSTGCGITFDGADVVLTNSSGTLYIDGASTYASIYWSEDSGSSPPVITVFGTNTATYTQNRFTTDGVFPSAPFTTNIAFVATDGSDQFGEVGNPQRPFLTVQSAVTNITGGGTIFVQPGSYSIGTVALASRSIVGSGRNKTTLTGGLNVTGTNVLLKDFRIVYSGGIPVSMGQGGVGATNTIIDNCYIYGSEDGIYLVTYNGLQVWSCDIESGWDCVADYQNNGNTNALAEFFNCRLYSHATTLQSVCVSIGPTRMSFNGGSMTASNGVSGLYTACLSGGSSVVELGRGGRIEVNNVKLLYGSTNHTAYAVRATTNMSISVSGFSIPNSAIIGSTNVTQPDAVNIGTNSTAVSANISLYFTNQDGTVYRVSGQRIVP